MNIDELINNYGGEQEKKYNKPYGYYIQPGTYLYSINSIDIKDMKEYGFLKCSLDVTYTGPSNAANHKGIKFLELFTVKYNLRNKDKDKYNLEMKSALYRIKLLAEALKINLNNCIISSNSDTDIITSLCRYMESENIHKGRPNIYISIDKYKTKKGSFNIKVARGKKPISDVFTDINSIIKRTDNNNITMSTDTNTNTPNTSTNIPDISTLPASNTNDDLPW